MMLRYSTLRMLLAIGTGSTLALAACGGKEGDDAKKGGEEAEHEGEKHEQATGRIITITATTDEKGNYYSPSEIEAKRGDILRFTLGTGVHNVNFLADSNAGHSDLPPASDMLQLPGQTYDVPLTFGEGTFYFQCDPHVALGMKGHVKVDD